jgi:acyl carrier protein
MTAAPQARAEARAGSSATLDAQLAQVPVGQRRDVLVAFVRQTVAAVLGADAPEAVPLEAGLFELGMDSLMSVELKRRLEHGAGRSLPSTLTFNYPNVAALAAFLDAELRPQMGTSGTSAEANAPSDRAQTPADVAADPDLDALSNTELEARLFAALERHRK